MKKRIKAWPLADSVIYATAKSRAAKVVSGDPHFRSMEDVIFIGWMATYRRPKRMSEATHAIPLGLDHFFQSL
ncbi:MAG: hypothetical protein ABSF00_09265 [Candidatus Bathyarchaeia archaeon]|jgi:hypothetical protein